MATATRTSTQQKEFAEWVRVHTGVLLRFARNRVKDPAVADDLVQLTFVSAWERLDRFAGDSSPRTWLFAILKHKFADHYRKAYREGIKVSGTETMGDDASATLFVPWAIADSVPERLAIVDAEGHTLAFGELEKRSNRLAHGLRGLGLQRGDGVAIVLPNEVSFVELYLATMQIGVYLTCINHHLTGPEIAYIVNDCEAKVLVVHERYEDAPTVAGGDIKVPVDHRFAVGTIAGFRAYAEIAFGQPTSRPHDRSPGASMLYTSGTTGRPKGVPSPDRARETPE